MTRSASGKPEIESSLKMPLTIGAIVSMVFTAGSMVMMWVFSAAALANASAESLQRVQRWVLSFSLVSLAGIALGIWLLCRHRPGWSALVALLPAIAMGGTLLYLVLRV